MSEFISIGDRIFNVAHIIRVDYEENHEDYYTREKFPRLTIWTSGSTAGDYGSETDRVYYQRNQAEYLAAVLGDILNPTMICLPVLDEPDPMAEQFDYDG